MKARCRKQEEEVTNPNKRSKLLLLFFFAFPKQTDLDVKIKNPFYGILYSIKEVEKRQRGRKRNKITTVRTKVVPCEPLGGRGNGIVGKFEGK